MLRYDISPLDPEAHLFIVGITISDPTDEEQILRLPNWIAGSYMIRDFAANVQKEEAFLGDTPVPIQKIDKNTWRVSTAGRKEGEDLYVYYQVWSFDNSVRMSYLDECRGFFNPASVFMQPLGCNEDSRIIVNINPPVDEMHVAATDWMVATSLKRCEGTEEFGWGLYEAANYDELLDHPVEMSAFTALKFEAHGVPHRIILGDLPVNFDEKTLIEDVKKICEAEIEFFEPKTRKAPFDEYTFLVNITSNGYGGLEHSNSCALICPAKTLPCIHDKKRTDKYAVLLDLIAHEYFHAWNVKRIKPAELVDIDYNKEVHTTLLWLFEGFTSYYDNLFLRRCGLIDNEQYAKLLSGEMRSVLERNARNVQTLAEASFDAWIKFYKPNANSVNSHVSYYRQGALAAWVIDAVIRQKTKGKKSLDDVMRALWNLYVEAGDNYAGLADTDFYEVVSEATGLDLTDLIDDLTKTTVTPDYAKLLKPLGVKLVETERKPIRAILGIAGKGTDAGFEVKTVYEHEAAQWVGIAPNDLLIAIDGVRIRDDNLEELLSRYGEGDEMVIHAFRDDALMAWTMLIGRSAEIKSTVKIKPTELGKQWLGE